MLPLPKAAHMSAGLADASVLTVYVHVVLHTGTQPYSSLASPCVQAAGTIHTDFERGFICAEVMSYSELKELGTEAAVKAAGKYRQEVRLRTAPCHPPIACCPPPWKTLQGKTVQGDVGVAVGLHLPALFAQAFPTISCQGGAPPAAQQCVGHAGAQGKNYVVMDGDIILFKFNVTSTGKK